MAGVAVATVQYRAITFVASTWVHAFLLTCNNNLAVWFKKGMEHLHGHVLGGVPELFVCQYPGTNAGYYELAILSDPGKFVRQHVYGMPYFRAVPAKTAGCN